MSHIRIILHRIRSRCHRMKIEHHHRKLNLDNCPLVVAGRVANEPLWTLRSPIIEAESIEEASENAVVAVTEQRSSQELDADSSCITVFGEAINTCAQVGKQGDIKPADIEREVEHCNCNCHGKEEPEMVSDVSPPPTSDSSSGLLNQNSASNSDSSDSNHSSLFKQFFSFAIGKRHKAVNVPSPIIECNTGLILEDNTVKALSSNEQVDPPLKHKPKKRLQPQRRSKVLQQQKAQLRRSTSVRKSSSVYSRNSAGVSVHSDANPLPEGCQCVNCLRNAAENSRESAWKIVNNRCSLQAALLSTGNLAAIAYGCKPLNADLTDCKPDETSGSSIGSSTPSKTSKESSKVGFEKLPPIKVKSKRTKIGDSGNKKRKKLFIQLNSKPLRNINDVYPSLEPLALGLIPKQKDQNSNSKTAMKRKRPDLETDTKSRTATKKPKEDENAPINQSSERLRLKSLVDNENREVNRLKVTHINLNHQNHVKLNLGKEVVVELDSNKLNTECDTDGTVLELKHSSASSKSNLAQSGSLPDQKSYLDIFSDYLTGNSDTLKLKKSLNEELNLLKEVNTTDKEQFLKVTPPPPPPPTKAMGETEEVVKPSKKMGSIEAKALERQAYIENFFANYSPGTPGKSAPIASIRATNVPSSANML